MSKIIRDFKNNEDKFKLTQNNIVYDGIIDENEFDNSELKILWILKEVNSPDDSDWDMRDALADLKNENGKGLKYGWANTFTPIVYTTYGLFNNIDWDNMGNFYENPEIIDILRKVAYINVKKVPGNSSANYNEIKKFYKNNKEAIHEQVQMINPKVLIFGNTLDYFDDDFFDLFGKLEEDKTSNSLHKFFNDNYLLLYAYHPNNRKITQREYCNLIISAVDEWKKNKEQVDFC